MQKKLKFAYILMCVTFSGLFIFWKEAAVLRAPLFKFIGSCINVYFEPNYNLMPSFFINGLFFNFYVFSVIFFASMLSVLGCRFIFKEKGIQGIFRVCSLVVMIVCFYLTGLQALSQIRFHALSYLKVSDKTVEQKNALYFSSTYQFSEFCKARVRGRNKGVLLSDLDLRKSRNVYVLAYQLFPNIEILGSDDGLADYLVLYWKDDAREFVPDDFTILAEFDEHNLLAKRK